MTYIVPFLLSSFFLVIGGGVVYLLLRYIDSRSAFVHRTAWAAVLLLGVLWFKVPVAIPVWETAYREPATVSPVETAAEAETDEDRLRFSRTAREETVAEVQTAPAVIPLRSISAFVYDENKSRNGTQRNDGIFHFGEKQMQGDSHADNSNEPRTSESGVAITLFGEPRSFTFAARFVIFAVWFLGIACFAVYAGIAWLRTLRRLRETTAPTGIYKIEWEALLAEMRISPRKIRLLIAEQAGPGLVRVLSHYVIVVPRALWEETNAAVRRGILKHELSHYTHGDLLSSFVLRVIALLHWFNPMARYAVRRFDEATEWRCDTDAFGRYEDGAADFAKAMLAFRDTVPVVATYQRDFCSNNLLERAKRLANNPQQLGDSIMKRALMFSCILLLVCSGLFRVEFVEKTNAQEETQRAGSVGGTLPQLPGANREVTQGTATLPALDGLTVELAGPDGKPAHGGYIRAYPDPRPEDWGDAPKNFDIVNGKCLIPLSQPEKLKDFSMIIYADGFAPFEADWNDMKADPVPKTYAIQLLPAVTVGGIVVDEQGKPIEGVKVEFHVEWGGQNRSKRTEGYVCSIRMKTDAEGRWSCSNIRKEELDARKGIEMAHPNYARVETDDIRLRTFLPNNEGNFMQKTVMKKGVTLTGTVRDEQGNPVENVCVFSNVINQSINNPDIVRTDAKGEFKFENCVADARTQLYVGVCKDGFAPDMISLARITQSVNPTAFVLKPGKTLKIRAVDSQGNGIKDVNIFPAKWRGISGHIVRFFDTERGNAKTDDDGRFVWHNAPSDEFLLAIGKGGYMSGQDVSVKVGDEENVFTLRPYMIVEGKVFNAETKQPIPTLKVMYGTGGTESYGGKIFWSSPLNPGQLSQTPEGFRWIQRQPVEGDWKWWLRVDVDGYETCVSEILPGEIDRQTLEFALQKKKPDAENPDLIIGTILTPDGKPAEGVQVGYATPQRHAQVDNGQINFDAAYTVKTDALGKFRLSKLDSSINEQDYKLIFLHDAGFATIRKEEFEKQKESIKLQAWGRIEGTVYAGKQTAKNAWATISYNPESERDWSQPHANYFYRTPCDENGRFAFNRVFPGKGMVGRSITINNGGEWPYSHLQSYEIKSGETKTVKIGGGGYAVAGYISLPVPEGAEKGVEPILSPIQVEAVEAEGPIILSITQVATGAVSELDKVDWRFASVTATLTFPEQVVVPERHLIPELDIALQNAPEMNTGWLPEPDVVEEVIRRWEESPEGKAVIARNPELYEKDKQARKVYLDFDRQRHRSWNSTVTCVVENGRFQLDDLTPGDWTLKVTLNFPKVPGQFWDLADVWEKTTSILIPELPDGPPDEPMQTYILLGHDKSERKGPQKL